MNAFTQLPLIDEDLGHVPENDDLPREWKHYSAPRWWRQFAEEWGYAVTLEWLSKRS